MTRTYRLLTALLRVYSERTTLIVLGALTLLLLTLGYVALVTPNGSFAGVYLNDVMGLTDAVYRTFKGQVPSVDFRSIYGAAIYYPAALGFHLGFDTGGVMGFGHFITAVPLLVIAVLAAYRRFPLLHSMLLVLFLFLIIVVPMRLGGTYSELTYGIFYTRHGWAALAIALLFYLEPRTLRRSDLPLDSVILSLLLLYLFYCKITFAAVALAFVAVNSITSSYKMRLSVISLSIFVVVVAVIHIFTEYNAAYLNDIFSIVSSKPLFRREFRETFLIIAEHLWIFILCFTALAALYLTGHRKIFDLAFVTGCILASLFLIDQSGGTERGLPGLVAVFLICGELARRAECRIEERAAPSSWPGNVASICVLGMLLAFVSEPIVLGEIALRSHFKKTTREQSVDVTSLSGIFVGAVPARDPHETLGHDDAAHAIYNQLRPRELTAAQYLPLIAEGVELLESVPHDDHSVITFQTTNPFSALLRMRPNKYTYPLFFAEFERLESLPTPERIFSDTDYVMVPEVPYSHLQLKVMMTAYGLYLAENFYELKRSPHWRLYARR